MTNWSTGSTLGVLQNDHRKLAEVLRRHLAPDEHVDAYVVRRDGQILALTQDQVHIVKPGLLGLSGALASHYAYRDLTHVAVHVSGSHLAFEVRTSETVLPDPGGAAFDRDYDLPNVLPLERIDLPVFEETLALILERVTTARAAAEASG